MLDMNYINNCIKFKWLKNPYQKTRRSIGFLKKDLIICCKYKKCSLNVDT